MKRISQACFIILICCLSLLSAGCSSGTLRALTDSNALRNDLLKEYKEHDINVVVQGTRILSISFINSALNNLEEGKRASKAREIALFARSHFASINSISTIYVSFVTARNFVVFYYMDSYKSYGFDKNRLDAPPPPNFDSRQQGTVAIFNQQTNGTDIYLKNNLQVAGNVQRGIMILPHCTISGDNVSAPKVVIPHTVSLDFMTYSDKRMFPAAPKVSIFVDDRLLISGKASIKNVIGSDAEKSVNEFLTMEITYSQFSQMTGSDNVKIVLGEKEIKLKPDHLDALRDMQTCITELKCSSSP